jgi:hypothetical protein
MPDQFGLPVGAEALRLPRGLSRKGRQAAQAVLAAVRTVIRAPDCGGCTAFRSGADWTRRGWGDYRRARLVVIFEGGDLFQLLSYQEGTGISRRVRVEMDNRLQALGLWFEDINSWSLAIYEK